MAGRGHATTAQYSLDDVIEILQAAGNVKLTQPRRIQPSAIDSFLFSGRFNSVLGLDGFKIFKAKLREVITLINDDGPREPIITLDRMSETVLDSGLYYVDAHLPEDLSFLRTDERWLTAYRYIARNFPDIAYSDFRTIVERFAESRGHSIYVDPSDSPLLLAAAERSDLFVSTVDPRAALLQMDLQELRAICRAAAITPARSRAETTERIVRKLGAAALTHVPQASMLRRSLVIRDRDLATGDDILRLDKYVRTISKLVRNDLEHFVASQRQTPFVSTC